jgi:tetratricopeptide (TPR) repeat protein/predicted Ser/Thr protein kinase
MEALEPSACLSDEHITAFVEGSLSPAERATCEAHLTECDACRRLVAESSADVELRSGPLGEELTLRAVDASDYEVGREIARGGMGRIFVAWDRRHLRRVAIKVLLGQSAALATRFLREVRITAMLQHPAIIPLYEAGLWSSGEPFFAMKLVEGRPLGEVVAETRSLAERMNLLPSIVAVTDALAYAHEQRVVHRDLKPSNVLLGAFGETVVIDWGLAKELDDSSPSKGASLAVEADAELTAAGQALGTPCYMAPEQARGEAVDARADVYALGALLYHLFAGLPPFAGLSAKVVLEKLLAGSPPPLAEKVPDLAPDLLTIVTKAMAREPSNRYATARAMADDLRRFANGQLVSAHRYSIAALARRWVARHRALVGMAVALLVAVGITAGVSVRRIVRERDRADLARAEADRDRAAAVSQRDAAEKLVGFIIGELRRRLEALGKLDLLAGIGKEVEGYYDSLGPSGNAPALGALLRRGAALDALASVEVKKRDFVAAELLARAAIDVYTRAKAQAPHDFDAAAGLASAEISLARVLISTQRGDDAIAAARHVDTTTTALAREHDEPRAWVLAALARGVLGPALAIHNDFAGARSAASRGREALARVGEATALDLEWKDVLATAYDRIGNTGIRTFDYGDAAVAYRAQNALRREELESEPAHVDRLAALVVGLRGLGFAEENRGDHEAALSAYREAMVIRRDLLVREPLNFDLLYDQAVALESLCVIEGEWSPFAAAEPVCTEARATAEQLVAARPDDALSEAALGRAVRARGQLLLTARRYHEAQEHFERALDIASRVLAQDPGNEYFKSTVIGSGQQLAQAELALGRPADAQRHALQAVAIAQQELVEAPAAQFFENALGLASVTLGDAERALRARAEARAAYSRAMGAFERAIAADSTDWDSTVGLAIACTKLAKLEPDASTQGALRARASALVAPLEAAGKLSPATRQDLEDARN